MARPKYTELTAHDVGTLTHALAVAYKAARDRSEANPQDAAVCAMECGDYLRLFKLIKEQPDVATRPLHDKLR